MIDPARYLNAPIGQPGSGRVRYGAAMELWRAGRISAEVLEVYRVTSAHDGRDPVSVLRERGLPLPEVGQMQSPLEQLYTVAREYLLALDHPGAEEVRAGLPLDPGPEQAVPSQGNAVVARWLAPALESVAMEQPMLARVIAEAAGQLNWITYDGYPLDLIGEGFARNHAYASIMGEDAPFLAQDFDMGLFLIAPGVLYRDRAHPAPELYAPLTGPHSWRSGVGRPLIVKPAHEPVWNPPRMPHLTRVGSAPFLCFFVWTRDVNEVAVVLPADDWAALEDAKIG
jgi:Dimethlysulfonioproprionate lyase